MRSLRVDPDPTFCANPFGYVLTAGDCANDVKRFCPRRDFLRQRSVRRLVRYILAAGKESQERSALSRDMLENRPTQHRILSLQCVEDRSSCHFPINLVNLNRHISCHACKRPQMQRHYQPNHGFCHDPFSDNVWTSTESTAGRSRTIGAQVSPASADAYTCPPVVPKYPPHVSSESIAIASRNTFT